MLLIALASALLAAPPQTASAAGSPAGAVARADTGAADTTARRRKPKPPPRRTPVTPELERSAFRDAGARTTLERARVARASQDSALEAYDAKTYQRVSVGMGFSRFARDRLLFRSESAARVRWRRGTGVWMDVTGQRAAVPMAREATVNMDIADVNPVPYFPGREALWFPFVSDVEKVKLDVDDREFVHPLAIGAEAYYRYASGDSSRIQLPNGQTILIRELRVEPRKPDFMLFAGSFWFDATSGQLVRAAYRSSTEMDIWSFVKKESNDEQSFARAVLDSARRMADTAAIREAQQDVQNAGDDVPAWVSGALSPAKFAIGAVTVEYGLHEGRFWMPRAHYAEGQLQLGFMRMPVKIEESFRYASVNGRLDSLPPAPVAADTLRGPGGSLTIGVVSAVDTAGMKDSARVAQRRRERKAAREKECAATGYNSHTESRLDGALLYAVRVPCDSVALARSADLPKSIYDDGDELFNEADAKELMSSLDYSLQPGWSPQPPTIHSGLDLVRYNRVEALSLGVSATSPLGRGYTAGALARLGVGDWSPNAELTLSRSNGRDRVGAGVYRRLAAANDDFGSPLTLGSSLASLLYARDEGFYYRTWGAELSGERASLGGLAWRLFAERQGRADANTNFSLGRAWGADFLPQIRAPRAGELGAALERRGALGSADPYATRLAGGLRAEAAAGTFDYARGVADATLSRSLFAGLAGALTGAAGTSGGTLAPQRAFYLGGLRTVRGQDAGTAVGDAFWLGRAEIGLNVAAARPVAFFDLGWAGRRDRFFSQPGRPISGAGVGASFLDGLIRFDLAEGVRPRKGLRGDLYLEAKF